MDWAREVERKSTAAALPDENHRGAKSAEERSYEGWE
jgi:hypothetical protein